MSMRRNIGFKLTVKEYEQFCQLVDALKPYEEIVFPTQIGWYSAEHHRAAVGYVDNRSDVKPTPLSESQTPTRDEMIEIGDKPVLEVLISQPPAAKPMRTNAIEINLTPVQRVWPWEDAEGRFYVKNPFGAWCNFSYGSKYKVGRTPTEIKENVWRGHLRYERNQARDKIRADAGAAKEKRAFNKRSSVWNGKPDEWRHGP